VSKPDCPKKKPSIYLDEEAERATRERLAGVLMFPMTLKQNQPLTRLLRLDQNDHHGGSSRDAVIDADRGTAILAHLACVRG